jgi:hypothetical protein
MIEDVDFLKQNSVKQSYMFIVDSKDRDKLTYREPSAYVVDFENPFHSVVGFEVLDASIPRTMYNIDVYNNTINFFIFDASTSTVPDVRSVALSNYTTSTVDPGDYNLQTLLPALTSAMTMHVNGDPSAPIAQITARSLSDPPELKNRLRFTCPYPFVLNMQASTVAEALGLDEFTRQTENDVPALVRRYDEIVAQEQVSIDPRTRNYQLFKSVDLPITEALGEQLTVFEGPRGVIRTLPLGQTTWAAQRFNVPFACFFTRVFAAVAAADGLADPSVQWELRRGSSTYPSSSSSDIVASGNIAISFLDGTLSDSEPIENPPKLVPGQHYWMVFLNDNALVSIYYNDVPDNKTTLRTTTNGGTTWDTPDIEDLNFQLSIRIETNEEYHQVVAPGIFSLIGEKYVILRCAEIEDNSYRSLAYSKYNLGLAKFKLGVVGYSENRVDFSKVPLREFHPIGKLARLTIRFETARGRLYDFKGVNHSITFAIHYYEPRGHARFEQSILNPNYRTNFIEYMYKQDDQESDSDDQEVDYSRDEVGERFRYFEQRNSPEQVRLRDLKVIEDSDED